MNIPDNMKTADTEAELPGSSVAREGAHQLHGSFSNTWPSEGPVPDCVRLRLTGEIVGADDALKQALRGEDAE
eukprot:15472117-Alexandrium_andersonii.AAC.1